MFSLSEILLFVVVVDYIAPSYLVGGEGGIAGIVIQKRRRRSPTTGIVSQEFFLQALDAFPKLAVFRGFSEVVVDADVPQEDVELDRIAESLLLLGDGGVGFDGIEFRAVHIEPVELVVLVVTSVAEVFGVVGRSLEALGLEVLIQADVLLGKGGDAGGAQSVGAAALRRRRRRRGMLAVVFLGQGGNGESAHGRLGDSLVVLAEGRLAEGRSLAHVCDVGDVGEGWMLGYRSRRFSCFGFGW